MKACHPPWKLIPSPPCVCDGVYVAASEFCESCPPTTVLPPDTSPGPLQAQISPRDDRLYCYWLCFSFSRHGRSRKSDPMINQEQLIKKRPSASPSLAALNLLRKASPRDIVYSDSIALAGRFWNNLEGQSEFFFLPATKTPLYLYCSMEQWGAQ